MKVRKIVFVAIKEFENLGIGYLSAVLEEAGYQTRIAVYKGDNDEILRLIEQEDPLIAGFSVIYQYHIDKFVNLISYLRKGGIRCHLTAGGHYASLKYMELFRFVDSLDSIVRFEGEYTFLELVNCIFSGNDFRQVRGIAYRTEEGIIANPLRPYEDDLDKFPFPVRAPLREYAFGKKFTSIIAGRGCIHTCSFCNLREYYRQSSGPLKRIRRAGKVVDEMEYLHKDLDCSVFLFEDDDFPVTTTEGADWILRLCREIEVRKLSDKILWKINCRADEIDEKLFDLMKRNGLYMVFIGIDDGTDIGLKWLNKRITVEKNLNGINILRKLGICFDYGFMLFQPLTTFSTLTENLGFLMLLCADGYNPVMFNKLRPYYETRIERELKKSGRLKGIPGYLDYDFLEERMTRYHDYIMDCFYEWLRDAEGLVNISRWARIYSVLFERCFPVNEEFVELQKSIAGSISAGNHFILDSMKEIAVIFESGDYLAEKKKLEEKRKNIISKHDQFRQQIIGNMHSMRSIAHDIGQVLRI